MKPSPWTPYLIAQLSRLWRNGTPTAEIGRQMGMPKNAIVAKAHRIGLPARPGPANVTAAREAAAEVAAQEKKNPGGGCRFIERHDYLDVVEAGGNPFCGKPVSEPGGSWCPMHRARVFVKKSDPAAFAAD